MSSAIRQRAVTALQLRSFDESEGAAVRPVICSSEAGG
jgi:hypothetical protein